MRTNRFIYFDVGNTLIDCSNYFHAATEKFHLHSENINDVFQENLDAVTKGYLSPQQLWELCIKRYSIPNALTYDFVTSWVSDYVPILEMHALVRKIASQYKIGLLSNIYAGMLPLLKNKKLIPDIPYNQIIFSCDVGMMKPNPDIYAFAEEKACVNPENLVLVDDRADYIAGAKNARWNTFLFNDKDPKNSVKELEEYLQTFD